MLSLTVDVPTAELVRAALDFQDAKKAGLSRVATAVQQVAIRKVGAIRRRRVPTRQGEADYRLRSGQNKSGRRRRISNPNAPLWEPTGNLLRAVEARPIWDGKEAVELQADVPYAQSRHELGVDWIPKAPALGVQRRDPFFADAVDATEPQIADLFTDGFNSVWENS